MQALCDGFLQLLNKMLPTVETIQPQLCGQENSDSNLQHSEDLEQEYDNQLPEEQFQTSSLSDVLPYVVLTVTRNVMTSRQKTACRRWMTDLQSRHIQQSFKLAVSLC